MPEIDTSGSMSGMENGAIAVCSSHRVHRRLGRAPGYVLLDQTNVILMFAGDCRPGAYAPGSPLQPKTRTPINHQCCDDGPAPPSPTRTNGAQKAGCVS